MHADASQPGSRKSSSDALADRPHPAPRPYQPSAQRKPDRRRRARPQPVESLLVAVFTAQTHRHEKIEQVPVPQFPTPPIRLLYAAPIDHPATSRALGHKPYLSAQRRRQKQVSHAPGASDAHTGRGCEGHCALLPEVLIPDAGSGCRWYRRIRRSSSLPPRCASVAHCPAHSRGRNPGRGTRG